MKSNTEGAMSATASKSPQRSGAGANGMTRSSAHAQLLEHVGFRVLRMREVCCRVGLGETCIRKMMARGEFPPQFKLGVRAVG
jgi:hypothetical protein